MPASQHEDRSRLEGFELEIFKLVRKGATSEQWREWLRVPLEHAAADGNVDLFTRLMDAGASRKAGWRGCHGRTLLAAAAYGRSETIVRVLLSAGAKREVNVECGLFNASPLYVAALRGAEGVSRMLVAAGADPNVRGGTRTPLQGAAAGGHHGIVALLLSKGALPNVKTNFTRESALHVAAKFGHGQCVSELLLSGVDKNWCDRDRRTPLHLAAQDNHVGVVEQLLAVGAQVDARERLDCCSSLDLAAGKGHVRVVRALLQHGSSVSSSGHDGYTALHRAADVDGPICNNGDVIRVLLEAGADIEARMSDDGYAALHLAACRRIASIGTIHALLAGGAQVSARDVHGDSPLHYACSNSCVDAVELLLRWGADEKLVNDSGHKPVDDVGQWRGNDVKRRADDQRIRHMLARAPAFWVWRRRGWLVLARTRPDKVRLVVNNSCSSSSSSSGDSSTKASKAGKPSMFDLQRLVGSVVGLGVEDVFRVVVGLL
eukprot:g7028.t1